MDAYLQSILFPGLLIRIPRDTFAKVFYKATDDKPIEVINNTISVSDDLKPDNHTPIDDNNSELYRHFNGFDNKKITANKKSVFDKKVSFRDVLYGPVSFSNFEKINDIIENINYEKWTQIFSKFDAHVFFIALKKKFKINALTITIIKALLALHLIYYKLLQIVIN